MLNSKKLEKIEKLLGKDKLAILDSGSEEELKIAIVNGNSSIKEAVEQLEANPKYQDLKENLKALSAGLKEVKKFQNAIIQYSLHILEEKGKQ